MLFRSLSLGLMAIILSAATAPCYYGRVVTITLDAAAPYHRPTQANLTALQAKLAAVTNDQIVFEGAPSGDPSTWTGSAKLKRAHIWLTAMLFGECRGQNVECMYGVGSVALNRARLDLDTRYGHGVYGTVRKRKQFSCLNPNDPNWPVIQKAMAGKLKPHSPDGIKWTIARGIALNLLHRAVKDPTHGALYYHALWVKPIWIHDKGMVKTVKIAGMFFYRKG